MQESVMSVEIDVAHFLHGVYYVKFYKQIKARRFRS